MVAVGLDHLTQIVNVNWEDGGVIFVVKDIDSNLFLGKVEARTKAAVDKKDWQPIDVPWDLFGGIFANSGSSSALIGGKEKETVFVVSARKEDDDGNGGSVIVASKNGKDWSLAFERYEVNEGDLRSPATVEPTGIVWDEDEKAFFASFYEADFEFVVDDTVSKVLFYDGETIYRSSDGMDWSQVIRTVTFRGEGGDATGITDDNISALKAYCKKPENKRQIPDGLQAYDETTKLFMKPEALSGFGPANGALYGGENRDIATSTITIESTEEGSTDTGGESISGSGEASGPVFAVAQYNGIWAAVGGDSPDAEGGTGRMIIDVSIDNGKTWTQVYTHADPYYRGATISAGKIKTETP